MNTILLAAHLSALAIPLELARVGLVSSSRGALGAVCRATYRVGALCLLAVVSYVLGAVYAPGPGPELVTRLGALVTTVVRVDALTCIALSMVCALAVVTSRYSRSYLAAEPKRAAYARSLALVLAAVTTLLIGAHWAVIAAAWMATSAALHPLLTFYDDRPQALLAAHKKFLVSRLADACFVAALALLHGAVGSLDMAAVSAWAAGQQSLASSLDVACVLLVIAVALRTAQLPFHGWLIQVMQAPTPVSALLHAGVVNLGGYVLLRMSPLLSLSPAAQLLLVLVGTTSAVVASLVGRTRSTVKVALAWSTCAQLGLMLVECGLGLWHLALLHLVAHSLYKAHAFLSAGTAVASWRVSSQLAVRPRELAGRSLAVGAGVVLLALALEILGSTGPVAATLPSALLLGLGAATLGMRAAERGWGALRNALPTLVGVIVLSFGVRVGAERLIALPATSVTAAAWAVAILGLGALLLVEAQMALRPTGSLARALQPVLFAGVHLDDLFTRLTFRIWPPLLPAAGPSPIATPSTLETES